MCSGETYLLRNVSTNVCFLCERNAMLPIIIMISCMP